MKTTKPSYLLPFFSFIIFFITDVQPQPSTVGYNCTAANQSASASSSCDTYVFYRAAPPSFLDLAAVADLFSVSRLMISRPSNISFPNATLAAGQTLLVPVRCACNAVNASLTISYAAVNYTIVSGDTFYFVSTQDFQNLTTYQSVEAVNPTFEPTRLDIGDEIVFPIFCRCPDESQIRSRVNYLISYVLQPSDRLGDVASRLGSTERGIVDVNGNATQPFDTIFVPVSRLPNLTQPISTPANPENRTRTRIDEHRGPIVGLGVGLGICGITLILVCGAWCYRERSMRRKGEKYYRDDEERKKKMIVGQSGIIGKSRGEEINLMADVSGCLDKYKVFKIEELKEATDGFDEKWLIRGAVYRGSIDGELFAIKKMKWNAYEELKILQKVNHGNLVRLEGFCIDPDEANCYLVYEYVENGSLHSWLHDVDKPKKLSWKMRLRIAIDVANGLQYIHEHTRPRVVHKDIKSSNILLDATNRAKIANFGLAKSGCNAITMHIVGTQGYIAPEYLSDGVISTKMDVFAFGVVLLELVSGREAVDESGDVLWSGASGILEGSEERRTRRVREWMDESLMANEETEIGSVVSVLGVAIACLNRDPAKRPSMVEIVYALSKSDDLFFDVSEEGISPRQVVAR